MAREVLAGDLETVYGLASKCVDRLEIYRDLCEGLGRFASDESGKPKLPTTTVREIDRAIASVAELGARLDRKLEPLLRTIQSSRTEDAEILDITAATVIEAVLRLAQQEGAQEAWEGRLDLSKPDHCAVLSRMSWAQRHDQQGVRLVRFDAEEVKAGLEREAGGVVCRVGGEFEHVSRALSGQRGLLFGLLVERQGKIVPHQVIAELVLGDEDADDNRIYQVKDRLMAILEADFEKVAKRIETVPGGYRLT